MVPYRAGFMGDWQLNMAAHACAKDDLVKLLLHHDSNIRVNGNIRYLDVCFGEFLQNFVNRANRVNLTMHITFKVFCETKIFKIQQLYSKTLVLVTFRNILLC